MGDYFLVYIVALDGTDTAFFVDTKGVYSDEKKPMTWKLKIDAETKEALVNQKLEVRVPFGVNHYARLRIYTSANSQRLYCGTTSGISAAEKRFPEEFFQVMNAEVVSEDVAFNALKNFVVPAK